MVNCGLNCVKKKKKITAPRKCVASFFQPKTWTSGCFVKMISQRSVKVKHKAEVKDKHNSCVLSASGDEPNLTSGAAAWQPEINVYASPALQWCACDFFLFWKFLSYSFFFFFWNIAFGRSWRVQWTQATSKDICSFWRVDGNENKRQSAPEVPFESTTQLPHISECSDVQHQQNKYRFIAICLVSEKKNLKWKTKKIGREKMFQSWDLL